MLSKAGYHTAISGKWHLGEEPKNQPQYNGFDEYYGFLGSTKNYTEWRDPRINPPLAADQAVVDKISSNENFIKHLIKAKRNQPHEEVYELDIPAIANVDLDTMENTINVIERMQHGEKPWFIYHAFGKVHNDNYPSDKFKASSAAKGTYQDAVTEVDYIVGRIINALKETGQAENTLVFFTSDNGPAESAWPDSGHTPFRGAKGSTWEGGVRVPGIAWWPNMIPAGGVSDGLFDLADLFTTFARLGGADLPNDRYIDGVDQTSFLLNENGSSNRKAIYYYLLNKFAAVRIGPFKQHRYIATPPVPEGISGYVNGSVLQKTSGLYVNNLYLDPKERKPIGLRTAIITKQLQTTQKQHKDTFKDFPPKVLLSLE
jgi:arylsulfatase